VSAATTDRSQALTSLREQARIAWQARTPRERQSIVVVVCVVLAFVIWSVLVEPALRTVREAPDQLDQLEAQYQQMQRVAAESAGLRGATRVSTADAALALRAATERLGEHGRLNLQGDRATLTLNGVGPQELRAWLIEARSGARARPTESQLQRNGPGYSGTIGVTLGGAS